MVKNKNREDYKYIADNKTDDNRVLNNKAKTDSRLENYQDASGLSWRQMNFGLWLAENRRNITRAIIILLILISAFFFIFSSYSYLVYFLRGPVDNQPESQVLSPRNPINEMTIGSLEIFQNTDSYDLAVRLQNNNDNFSAEFNYCFYQGEITLDCRKGYILPSEDKYLLSLGLELQDLKAVSFQINDIFWTRVNRRQIPDWAAFFKERINFETANINFLNASRSGLSENIRLNSLEFDFINHSAYSYFNAPLNIYFYNGSDLIGVKSYVVRNFLTGETRPIKIVWSGDLEEANRIEIVPNINILDDQVYLRFGRGM